MEMATSTQRPSEIRIKDPLSEVTRAERKTLLGVSAIGIIIAKSGLVPSKISALGIEFDRTDQSAILKMLSAVVAYFLIAFVIYASSDLIAWQVSLYNSIIDWRRSRELFLKGGGEEPRIEYSGGRVWTMASGPMSFIRAFFEFVIPIIVGVVAFVSLVKAPPPKSITKDGSAITSTSIGSNGQPASPSSSGVQHK